ncbi:MAG TPA: hypothetical protein IGS40_28920 [Trichormus sp. M33_DOE_039]|nr:hypothetical protein [Trichormus sp. M33_DOE_039]
MQDTLFTEISAQESALVNGGDAPVYTSFAFDWNNLFYTLGVGAFFGLNLFQEAVTSSIFRRY